jgi:hypothetical protein
MRNMNLLSNYSNVLILNNVAISSEMMFLEIFQEII